MEGAGSLRYGVAMTDTAEVKVKLVLDQNASDTAKKVAGDLVVIDKAADKTKDKLKEAEKSGDSFFKKLAANAKSAAGAGALGVAAVAAVGLGVVAASGMLVAASMGAAFEKAERLKSMSAQLVSFSPEKNMSFAKAQVAAKAFDDEFRRIGITAGVAQEEIRAAFDVVGSQVGTRARLSLKETEEIARNMAMASKVVPGGLGKLTQEYENLKGGVFGSSGSIVQMITSTGVLKGNAVEVAKQLASKDTITRMKIAEDAMGKMAKQAGDMQGWSGLKQSFAGIKDGFLESVGTPIINRVLPVVNRIKDFFVSHSDAISRVAGAIGDKVSYVFDKISSVGSKFVSIFGDQSDAAGQKIEAAFKYAEDAFRWIYDNREALAKTFKDIAGVIARAFTEGASALGHIADKIKNANKVKGEFSAEAQRHYDKAKEMAADPSRVAKGKMDIGGVNDQFGAFMIYAKREGLEKEALEMTKNVQKIAEETRKGVQGFDEAMDAASVFGKHRASMDNPGTMTSTETDLIAQREAATLFAAAYAEAQKTQNEGRLKYAENLLKGSKELQDALLKAGVAIEGGMLDVARRTGDTEFINKARELDKSTVNTGKAIAPQVNFNGATINIKQDFRDQDPDRVAIVFKNDIAKAAVARRQAVTQTPFGM